MSKPRSLVVILGPTASGKSSLSVKLARYFSGVVISADSRQVYRNLNIGTAKITRTEMKGVPHFLLNVASPRGQYSVSRYVRDVRRVLAKLPADQPIFLVGGSPFYIKALTTPNSFSTIPPDPKLRRRLAKKTASQLLVILQHLNPDRAKNIDSANRRRLIRAIEISKHQTPPLIAETPALFPRILKIGLQLPRPRLYHRIDTRIDRRLKHGLVQEVARLHRYGLTWKKLDSFGLEYRFVSRYLRGQLSLPATTAALKSATHDFARRQMTWWRRESDIHWITKSTDAKKLIGKFLEI
jgi:tRNA dimethylallyltransferase